MVFFYFITFSLMKKLSVFVLVLTQMVSGFAQKSKAYDAISLYRDYQSSKDAASLTKAKENIDLAAAHPETQESAKVQVTKGQIYLSLYELSKDSKDKELSKTVSDINQRGFQLFEQTPTADLDVAYEAFTKAKSLDAKGDFANELKAIKNIGVYYDNTGRSLLNSKKYPTALASFEKAYKIAEGTDSTLLYFCAVSSEYSGENEKAKMYYQKMIEAKYDRDATYSSLFTVCLNLKDTACALDAMSKGRAKYPNNMNMVIQEANYYLRTNNSPKALNNLNIVLTAKPNDANMYLVRGNIYDNMANPKDAYGKDLPRPAEYDNYIAKAETDYQKAIELKPSNFDALYNLGVLYNNRGVLYTKLADDILDNAQNSAMNAKATEQFQKAMPVLEKALSLSPNDAATMMALKQIYARLQLLDKHKEISEKLGK